MALNEQELLKILSAVERGDFDHQLGSENGEIAEKLNLIIDKLNGIADEFTRIAREVGTEGRFGGQAEVHNTAGSWKDLVDNINFMAANLTDQIRDFNRTSQGVAQGNPALKSTVFARGETLELKENINSIVERAAALS